MAVAMPSTTMESFAPAPSTVVAAANRFLKAWDSPANVEVSNEADVNIGLSGTLAMGSL